MGDGEEYSGGEGADGVVVPGEGFEEKLLWLRDNAKSGGGYIIELNEDLEIYQTVLSFMHRIDITITMRGVGENRTIALLYMGNLFYVTAGVTLVLENNVTLAGYGENIYPLVYIEPGGAFTMNSGSAVTRNISSVTGAVYVDGGTFTMNGGAVRGNSGGNIRASAVTVAGGTFTMNGGTISGNAAPSGGTVTMLGGTFTMNGGAISGNAAKSGGAVMVGRGIFTMNGGTVSGNTASGNGGAVAVGAEGTFTMSGGVISGNKAKAYGGAVYVSNTGNFCMKGGAIRDNTAAYYGWGVFVSGTFTKSGGTISAGTAATTASAANSGLAVYAYSSSGVRKRRESAAGPEVNLSYSGMSGEYSGEWDF